jgi:hypothetical protein
MNELDDLVRGRPGWRLEPMATPGSPPAWCFAPGRKIEFSVTAERDVIRLYVMESDQETVFGDVDELAVWLRTNRPEALQEPAPRLRGKSRLRKAFRWD